MKAVVGTAGWSIARDLAAAFPREGSSLERYAKVFHGVEVNSSFHRPHRASTWAKWASSVSDDFRFAVKIPKTITHQSRLVDVDALIEEFATEVGALGSKLAIVLVQLPPTLVFDPPMARRFFEKLRNSIAAHVVCEPRNATWFEEAADDMLIRLRVARAAADPALSEVAAVPGGWREIEYWRLHGSPVMYRSSYADEDISKYARKIKSASNKGTDSWCMFDNTARSAALHNALSLIERV
ncbi:DUF72 domain-containing protein [Sphingomonas sp. 3P27F8]|uniref:DUF72 domain-containing protein n=1 Tax=Sphingomonas sp. 3P27F8 TaxID=2502213 RepID=UPI0010F9E998|nr:DUF72 domain-containing protein [Sphingomonas sp. 3P27F8]